MCSCVFVLSLEKFLLLILFYFYNTIFIVHIQIQAICTTTLKPIKRLLNAHTLSYIVTQFNSRCQGHQSKNVYDVHIKLLQKTSVCFFRYISHTRTHMYVQIPLLYYYSLFNLVSWSPCFLIYMQHLHWADCRDDQKTTTSFPHT